jgi:hypothetical protein
MTRHARLLLLSLSIATASCSDSTGSSTPRIEVTAVTPVTYGAGFPALTFTLANHGAVTAENVAVDVDALRSGVVVDQAVTTLGGLEPRESAVSDPAVLADLDSHADYDCYRYRVRTFGMGGETMFDRRFPEVCR